MTITIDYPDDDQEYARIFVDKKLVIRIEKTMLDMIRFEDLLLGINNRIKVKGD